MTMTLVSTVTVGAGGAASIDFTSIPQTATDLYLVLSARSATTENTFRWKFNNDTANQTYRELAGNGSSTFSQSFGAFVVLGLVPSTHTANTFNNVSFYVANYSGSTNKSVSVDSVTENNATAAYATIAAALWSSTAAITSFSVYPNSGNFAQYSTASLYTITNGSGGASVS